MRNKSFFDRVLYMWPAKIICIAAALLLYFFTRLVGLDNRYLSLPIHYVLPSAYVQGEDYPTRARVQLRGNPESIFSVQEDDIQVSADFSEHEAEGQFQETIKVRRLGAAAEIEPLEISVEPQQVVLDLEKASYKDVPLRAAWSGTPKPGYQVLSYSFEPKTVRITGPEGRLAQIDSVTSEDVELGDGADDFVRDVRLKNPDSLVRVSSLESAVLRVHIGLVGSAETVQNLKPVLIGLDPGLSLSGELPPVTLRVQASKGSLSDTDKASVRVLVDASGLKAAGDYTLKIIPDIPSGISVLEIDPETIDLKLDEKIPKESP